MDWRELRSEIWAKSPRQGQAAGESLDDHTREVLTRLAQLGRRFPALPERLGDERVWHRMFWACFLHDVGKAAGPWQAFIRGRAKPWAHRHEVASLAFLPWVIDPSSPDFPWVAAVVASHHRDGNLLDGMYPLEYPEDLDLPGLVDGFNDQALSGLTDWLREAPAYWIERLGFAQSGIEPPALVPDVPDLGRFREKDAADAVLAGLAAYKGLRRTLDRGDAETNRRAIVYRGLMVLADRLGSAHADSLLSLHFPDEGALLGGKPLREHQRACAATTGSVLMAAPTGSGKTEAGLLWARHQLEEQGKGGACYYLLPYQASTNAMQARLQDTLGQRVGLLHGRAVQALYRRLLGDGFEAEQAERIARWARNLAGLQQPAVQVATPYQLLRAGYRVRGFEAVWAGLMGSLILVDEIHAYEPKRLGLFLAMLKRLVDQWDSRVCAMTATMPGWLRDEVHRAIGGSFVEASVSEFAAFERHRIELLEGDLGQPEVLSRIVDWVRNGEAVLVCANTVRGAQRTWESLSAALGKHQTVLLHSRLTGRDRLEHEQALLERYGLGASPRSAGVAIATQTIEVSLNLDFDRCVSEPAPLEALCQRFGRVNRLGRLGHAPVHVLSGPLVGQGIYDARLVQRTLSALKVWDRRPLDEARVSSLLDAIYDSDLSAEFRGILTGSRREFERSCLDMLRAFDSDDEVTEQFERLFDGVEVLPAVFKEDYAAMVEEEPLDAAGLLLPLRYRQLAALRRAGAVERGPDRVWVVDRPYDRVRGLDLG